MNQPYLRRILTTYKIIAVVGISRNPSRDSYRVAEYLKTHGFNIVPINPSADEILDEKSYKSLLDIPVEIQKTIEIVDVFRPSKDALPIVEQVIQLKKLHGFPKVVWMQLGIVNEEAAEKARESGLLVVMDRCMMREHKHIFGSARALGRILE
ncbi:MAG: CoA-binding protein [Candidatus Bathyarchaeota archaeon]|nr:CoA-binding protein [Candidatus Bathyarchaeota archaeon]